VAIIVIITGTQADIRRPLDRAAHILTAVAQLVGEFDDQDAVLRHDADEQTPGRSGCRCSALVPVRIIAKTAQASPSGTVDMMMRRGRRFRTGLPALGR
jgi:hypothetical protein